MKPNAIRENPIFPLVLALHSANPRYNNTMNYHYNTLCALHRYIIIASACIQAVYDVPHFKVTGQCSAHARKLLRMPHTSQCT